MRLLVELGGNVNAVNEMGLGAVHGAANRGSDDIIELLGAAAPNSTCLISKNGRRYVWAEGVFLATDSPVAKATTMALIKTLLEPDRGNGQAMNNVVLCGTLVFVAAMSASLPAARQAAPDRPTAGPAAAVDGAFLQQYCLSCHNARTKSGGLALDALDAMNVDAHAEEWEKVVRKLRTGMMPPEGAPKPTTAAREAFTASLETVLDRAAARQLDPGTPALHRLNRTEYAHAIRDLLALDVDVSALLPPDDSAVGFDNIADVLGISPALIEGYVVAASRISRLAMGDPAIGLDRAVYRVPGDLDQDAHIEGLPLGTRGGIVVRHTFPLDADYDLQVGQASGARLGGPRRAVHAATTSIRNRWPARRAPGTRCHARQSHCRTAHHRGCVHRPQPDGRCRRRLPHRGAKAGRDADHDRRSAQRNGPR